MTDTKFPDPSDLATLDDFLDEDGVREEVTLRAVKSVIALQLQQAMKAQGPGPDPRRHGRRNGDQPHPTEPVLDPEASNVTLDTLSRAARVLGRALKVELV